MVKSRKNDIKTEYAILRQSLMYAVEIGALTCSPMANISWTRGRHKSVDIFTPDEIQQLVTHAHPPWFGDVIEIGYRTGMRRGEIFGLKWTDIDLDGRRLMVNRSLSGVSAREIYIRPPKTASSQRTIALDNRSIEIFARLKSVSKYDWVFTRPGGLLQPPTNVSNYMRKTCLAAGVPRRNFHALRHTHASILLGAGVHPKVVQERLGHSDLITTLNVYGHLLPTMQDAAIDVLNHLCSQSDGG